MHVPGRPDPPAARLLDGLADGAAVETLVLSTGSATSDGSLDSLLAGWVARPQARVLILGTVGSHRDARASRLRALWTLEEKARAAGLPVLALRLSPIVGPRSPLWLRLRAGGAPRSHGESLLQPVAEEDVRATLAKALIGTEDWSGWFDVTGPEALTLAELAAMAGRNPSHPHQEGAWEPSLEELAEQRLCDDRPWRERFAITPRRVSEEASAWA